MSNKPIVQRVAAKAVITNKDGKVLILREASTYQEGTNIGRYHLPGGRINLGESFLAGLKREVREETGLEIEAGAPVFVGEWFPVIKAIPHQIVAIFFACTPLTAEVALSDEHDHYAWIAPAELERYDIMPPDPEAIMAGAARQ